MVFPDTIRVARWILISFLVSTTVPVGTNKAIDKNSTPHHSGSNHETKV